MGLFQKLEQKIEAHRAKKEAFLQNQVAQRQQELNKASQSLAERTAKQRKTLETIQRLNKLKAESRELRKATFQAKHPRAAALGKKLGELENKAAIAGGRLAKKAAITGGRLTVKGLTKLGEIERKALEKKLRRPRTRYIRVRPRKARVSKSSYRRKPRRKRRRSEEEFSLTSI